VEKVVASEELSDILKEANCGQQSSLKMTMEPYHSFFLKEIRDITINSEKEEGKDLLKEKY